MVCNYQVQFGKCSGCLTKMEAHTLWIVFFYILIVDDTLRRIMRFSITARLFHQPLRPGEIFGMVLWKDETKYSWDVNYTLGIAYGNSREDVLNTYEDDYRTLISIISLEDSPEEEEDEDEREPDNILQVSLWSIRSSNVSVPITRRIYQSRSMENHFAIRRIVYNGKQTIEIIINGKNVGVYEENIRSDCFVYPVIIHESSSTDVLVYRYGDVQPLQKMCREAILQKIDKELFNFPAHAMPLPLPTGTKYYVLEGVNPNELEYVERTDTNRSFRNCRRFENKGGRYGPTLGYYGIFP